MKKIILMSLLSLMAVGARASVIDHSAWDNLLKTYVSPRGNIDYKRLEKRNLRDLRRYLTLLSRINLSNVSDDEKLAFWINAYNAHVVRLIIDHHVGNSVAEIPKLFDERFRVAGLVVSLNDIEHRILRSDPAKGGPILTVSLAQFDPRVHFALSYGAVGSPRLIDRAYQAESVHTQLEANAVEFANTPKYLRVEKTHLVMSTLMKWYEKDFTNLGGTAAYLLTLVDPAKRSDTAQLDSLLNAPSPDTIDFQFDWTLNDRQSEKAEAESNK